MRFSGSSEEDDHELDHKVREVKAAVADLLRHGLEDRKRIF